MKENARLKTVFVSDLHVPYQDDVAVRALTEFIRWFEPDVLIFLGDSIDFQAISRYRKSPEMALKLQYEIDETIRVTDGIIAAAPPEAKIYYLEGNHERRLQSYLETKAPELHGLRSMNVDHLLQLSERGIEYISPGRMVFHGILVKHGDLVRKFPGYTAKAEMEAEWMSGVSGHTHRSGVAEKNTAGGRFKWLESGCLCRFDMEYLEGKVPDWQLGFSIGYFWKKSERFDLQIVEIIDGKAMYGGEEF